MMIRSVATLSLIAVLAAVSVPAVAGGGGGAASNVAVRMKNVGTDPVAVNARSGNATITQLQNTARTIAANGVAQFTVKKGAFRSIAADPDNTSINSVRSFQTRNNKVIYLYAQQDTAAATLVGAPGGVKF